MLMKKKKIAALFLSLALCAGAAMTLTGCDSDDKRPPGPPPGAASGGAAGFPGAPPNGEKPDGTPPADFKPPEDGQPPEGFEPPEDGQPPEGFNPPDDWQPPNENNN